MKGRPRRIFEIMAIAGLVVALTGDHPPREPRATTAAEHAAKHRKAPESAQTTTTTTATTTATATAWTVSQEAVAPEILALLDGEVSDCRAVAKPAAVAELTGRLDRALLASHPDLETRARATARRLAEAGESCLAALIFGKLGDALSSTDPAAAAAALQEALALAARNGDLRHYAGLLNDLALAESRRQRFRQALEHNTGARFLWHVLGQRDEWLNSHLNVGALYFRIGRWRAARRILDEACTELRGLEAEAHLYGACLTWRGRLLTATGEFDNARRDFEESLELRRRRGVGLAPALDALGTLAQAQGKFDQSIDFLERALEATEAKSNHAHTYNNLAETHLLAGRLDRALELSRRALDLSQQIGSHDPTLILHSLYIRARTFAARGDTEKFAAVSEHMLSTFEHLRSAGQGDLLLPFFSRRRLLLDFLIQEHAAQAPGAEAFAIAEMARSRALLERLVAPPSKVRLGAPQRLLEKDRRTRERLDQVVGLIDQQTGAPSTGAAAESAATSPSLEALRIESHQLRLQLMSIEAEMRGASELSAMPAMMDLEKARQLIQDNTLVLAFWLGEDQSLLWIIDRERARLVDDLPPRRQIERSARRLLELMGKGPSATEASTAEARALSEVLLGPAAADLEPERPLALIVDDALALVPFAALPKPEGAPKIRETPQLVEEHALTFAYSLSIVAALRDREPVRRRGQNRLLSVLADAIYSRDDPRFSSNSNASNSNASSPKASNSNASNSNASNSNAPSPTRAPEEPWQTGPRRGPQTWSRLESSGHEAQAITANRGIEPHLGFEASKSLVLSGALEGSRYIHFGTHARVDSEAPSLSSVELAAWDFDGRPVDASLRLRDMDRIRLHADLVTLAGCGTALGELLPGEGLLALPRGFLHAGAASVLASVWDVADKPTAELMTELYHQLIDLEQPPAEALRQAQLQLARGARWSDPRFWAGFMLIGDWQPGPSPSAPKT